jgi:hypothetical protein
MKNRIWTKIAIGMVAVLVLALSATLAFAQTDDGTTTPEAPTVESTTPSQGQFGRHERRGHHGKGAGQEYLAAELGITVEELEAAEMTAREAAMADRAAGIEIDRDAGNIYLAGALGISVEELAAANAAAREAGLAQAITDGIITQEQADLMQAREALKDYIDRDALMEDALASLGISADELEAAKTAGTNPRALLEELGLTAEDVTTAVSAAHDSAIAQAVADGIITQAQADQIGENAQFGRGGPGHHGRGHRGFDGHGGGFSGFGTPDAAPQSAPTGLSFGA